MPTGSLVVVGTGIRLASQCTPEVRQQIECASVVYAAGGDPAMQHWLESLNANTVSLHRYYDPSLARRTIYENVIAEILGGLRQEEQVCAVFYGHPGVFVYAGHEAVRRARNEGYEARMLPAVSAEDCLFADLAVDPARAGCQSYEATDFVINARRFDTTAALVLWQIALTGDMERRAFGPDPRRLQLLAEVLMMDYPPHHIITIYEAATLPMTRPRIEKVALRDLAGVEATQLSTLFVPPLTEPDQCPERLALARRWLGD